MQVNKVTPILTVEAIEPVIPFWVERLGFKVAAEVPEGDRIGFVILVKDGREIMYQTLASLRSDLPALVPAQHTPGSILFLDVEDIRVIEAALSGEEVLVPRRETFYGTTEVYVREPGGHVIGFAQTN